MLFRSGTFTTWNGGQDLPGYTVELAPGDAIFLPAGWWHAVTALSPSVSVTTTGFRWSNDFRWYAPGAL